VNWPNVSSTVSTHPPIGQSSLKQLPSASEGFVLDKDGKSVPPNNSLERTPPGVSVRWEEIGGAERVDFVLDGNHY
jgi:hypothetical protein